MTSRMSTRSKGEIPGSKQATAMTTRSGGKVVNPGLADLRKLNKPKKSLRLVPKDASRRRRQEEEERKTPYRLGPRPNDRNANQVFAEPAMSDRAARQAKRSQKAEEDNATTDENTS